MKKRPIYLDYQSTTPVDKRVLDEMLPYFSEKFGNANSKEHVYGWESEAATDLARARIAKVINAKDSEIIFTSGATESNNLALIGTANFYGQKKNHIITCITEHKSIIETCKYLEKQGFNLTYLKVSTDGIIDLNELKNAITENTLLVSIMAVNNEIGVIQDLRNIGKICKDAQVFFHSDIAQAFGKIAINVNEIGADLLSISGHKIYGPKGIGALYIRNSPAIRLMPLLHGGGQELGLRSGTLATELIVGLGKASEISNDEMLVEQKETLVKKELFYNLLKNNLPDIYLNGSEITRISGNLNISFSGIKSDKLISEIKGLAISSSSACASGTAESSYVIKALGYDQQRAKSSLRFSIGKPTTEEEIREAANMVINAVNKLREKMV